MSASPETTHRYAPAECREAPEWDVRRLDQRRDYVRLYFGGDLTAAMSVSNRGGGVFGCSVQFSRLSRLDFVAKKGSLAISDGHATRRRRPALFGPCLDGHMGETRAFEFAPDERRIVVSMRRARQKARRIVRKNTCKSIRHIIRKYILLDPIPYAKQKSSLGLQNFASPPDRPQSGRERTSRRTDSKRDRRSHLQTAALKRPLGAI